MTRAMTCLLVILGVTINGNTVVGQIQNLYPESGSVGIGTSSPRAALEVNNGSVLVNKDLISNLGGEVTIRNGFGNQNGAVRLNLNNGGAISWIKGIVTGPNTNYGSAMIFGVPSATVDGAEVMRITSDGSVGIGTSTPDAKLSVNGIIHAKEVKVDLNNWPDYVFSSGSHLRDLDEVSAFIRLNRHLPDIPSANTVAKEGLHLGEINKLLTQKVEELTLYLLEQHELNKKQQKQIDILTAIVTELKMKK